ncbi:hypothetical protein CNECB9_1310018 [Cupriavidus necator]|uniref:Uncharacterized protein n=1 Tax=Cupriavidus necator TaxID=106590 RepID=A0A1K0I8Y4_CUPNE|nr:hypothetical protein CNECB9_1310018 [Cupriavidus necator]
MWNDNERVATIARNRFPGGFSGSLSATNQETDNDPSWQLPALAPRFSRDLYRTFCMLPCDSF